MAETKILDPTVAAVEVDAIKSNGVDPYLLTMSTGVQFRIKPISKHVQATISERYARTKPFPPVTFVKSKGREEENHDDPVYADKLGKWYQSLVQAHNNYALLRGMDLVEKSIPDGMIRHDSDEWKHEMEIIGGDIDNPRVCYLEWVKMIAAPSNTHATEDRTIRGDIDKLLRAIGRISGTLQEDVDEAVDGFQR